MGVHKNSRLLLIENLNSLCEYTTTLSAPSAIVENEENIGENIFKSPNFCIDHYVEIQKFQLHIFII